MHMTTPLFPLKVGTLCKGQTLPHHLWPKSVMDDVYAISNHTKALRRLAALAAITPYLTLETQSDTEFPHHHLRLRVTNPLTL
jgi:hypothetical protein